MTDKQAVLDALQRLPESATLDEITEELRIMAAIRRGREDVKVGRTKTQDEVEKQLKPQVHIDIFELETSVDLFKKLESDLAKMEAENDNSWVAFDFFVTARHLPDWRRGEGVIHQVKKSALLRIVCHIADGLKHFNLDSGRHKSVLGTAKSKYVENCADGKPYFEEGYFQDLLTIQLAPSEAKELKRESIDLELGSCPINKNNEMDALTLGRLVVAYWRKHLIPKLNFKVSLTPAERESASRHLALLMQPLNKTSSATPE